MESNCRGNQIYFGGTIEFDMIPLEKSGIEGVDRDIVGNTARMMLAIKHPNKRCSKWSIDIVDTNYLITCYYPLDTEFTQTDFSAICGIEHMRIMDVGCKVVMDNTGKNHMTLWASVTPIRIGMQWTTQKIIVLKERQHSIEVPVSNGNVSASVKKRKTTDGVTLE